jgi:hypothetical protein
LADQSLNAVLVLESLDDSTGLLIPNQVELEREIAGNRN